MKTTKTLFAITICFFLSVNYLFAQTILRSGSGITNIWTDNTEVGSDPKYAVDGNENTFWQTVAIYNPVIEFELDKVYDISKVVMKWDGDYGAQPWDIYYSTDGTYNSSNRMYAINPATEDYTQSVVLDGNNSLFHPFSAQYVKLTFRGRHVVGGYYKVKEFEMYTSTTGLKKIDIANLKISPNPVKDVLYVSAESTINYISVFNINGSEIEKYSVNADNYTLSTSNWNSGAYIVKIITNEGCKTERIIK